MSHNQSKEQKPENNVFFRTSRFSKALYFMFSVLCSMFLLSCGVQESTGVPATVTTVSGATIVSDETDNPDHADRHILATYQVSGGIAGIDETLTVRGDGSLEFVSNRPNAGKTGQATPEQVKKLLSLINDPAVADLQRTYGQNQCCDRFTYVITIGNKTITTYDGMEYPQLVGDLIDVLSEIRDSVK